MNEIAANTQQKAAWNAKTYKRYQVYLRQDDDADLIKWIDENKGDTGTSELFRTAIDNLKNKS